VCILFENGNVFVLLDAKDMYKTEDGCWLLMLAVYYLACIFSCQLLICGMHLCTVLSCHLIYWYHGVHDWLRQLDSVATNLILVCRHRRPFQSSCRQKSATVPVWKLGILLWCSVSVMTHTQTQPFYGCVPVRCFILKGSEGFSSPIFEPDQWRQSTVQRECVAAVVDILRFLTALEINGPVCNSIDLFAPKPAQCKTAAPIIP